MRASAIVAAWLAGASMMAAFPAMAQTAATTSPPGLSYTQPLTPQAVQLVQRQLRQLGAYGGRIDGVWGPDSQAALERFQQQHNLQVTGQLNEATAATLGLTPGTLLAAGEPAPPVVPPPIPGSQLSRNSVAAIQSRLRDLNFYRGAVDGVWGASTQQAIEQFQQGRGLQPNGQLNPATIAALGLNPNLLVPNG